MLEGIWILLVAAGQVLSDMAPLLLLGFALAGILHVLLPAAWVARHLGGRGLGPVWKAAALGVPMPVCSCGVIPLAATLRHRGAGPGALLAFLTATPQTSVDSILLCLVLLGPLFAIASPVSALVAALLAGLLGSYLLRSPQVQVQVQASTSSPEGMAVEPGTWWRRALRHGFGTLARDVAPSILIGVLVAGAVRVFVPPELFAGALGSGLFGKLAILAAAVPLYVCSNGAIPIAAALLAAGVSPGTALVFLLAGPATTAATIAAVRSLLGWSGVAIYLCSIIALALGVGTVVDVLAWGERAHVHDHGQVHQHEVTTGIGALAALILLVLMLRARWLGRAGSSCCGPAAAPVSCCGVAPVAAPAPRPCCCSPGTGGQHLTASARSLASDLPNDTAPAVPQAGR